MNINFYDGIYTDLELQIIALGVLLVLIAVYLFIGFVNRDQRY